MRKSQSIGRAGDVGGEKVARMTVRLVLNDKGWILEKMAKRLAENLPRWNVDATIDTRPSQDSVVNHWMLYTDLSGKAQGIKTMLITHVDRAAKLHVLRRRLISFDMGICLSRMTMQQLTHAGIPAERLCFITPAHDGIASPRRISIGITTQLRNDGAKREDLLLDMARTIRLDAFHFEIIGPRWEKVIPVLQAAGATVRYASGAYQSDNQQHLKLVHDRLQIIDYYLYFGFDEGSMGFLDALAAGVPTIATPQGFHIDINDGITYSFRDSTELTAVFQGLSDNRQRRMESVAGLTWNEYARQHALVWRALKSDHPGDISSSLHGGRVFKTPLPDIEKPVAPPYRRGRSLKWRVTSAMEDISFVWEFYTNRKLDWTKTLNLFRRFRSILSH
jgi:hypothetical protein